MTYLENDVSLVLSNQKVNENDGSHQVQDKQSHDKAAFAHL